MSTIFSKVDVTPSYRSIEKSTGPILHAVSNPEIVKESPLPSNFKSTKWCVPLKFEKFADRIENFKIRPDDIWLVGFYKSGTTWMHNIIWQLKNNLPFSTTSIGYMNNFFELPIYHSATIENQFDILDGIPSPRIIKSHLPAYLLPKELWTVRPKIVYTARNPKDIAVSMFHFWNALRESNLPRDDIFDAFLNELTLMSPIHAHVLSFWEMRHLDHVFFSKYEDLLADEFGNVKRIAEFLECALSDEEINGLVDHVSFENMRPRIGMVSLDGVELKESGYRFCRKGKAGGYRDEMTEEYIKRFDEWTADRLKNSDFTYANV